MEYATDLARYLATAKRGTWTALVGAVKTLTRLTFNGRVCDFSTKEDGSFFVLGEGATQYELLLVAPDDSLDWPSLASMSVLDLLVYLEAYTNDHEIPGWTSFVRWFDSKYSVYGGMVSSGSICGCAVSSIPSYSNPAHSVQVWFDWVLQLGQNAAGLNSVSLSGYRDSAYQYGLPMIINTTTGVSVSMEIKLAT